MEQQLQIDLKLLAQKLDYVATKVDDLDRKVDNVPLINFKLTTLDELLTKHRAEITADHKILQRDFESMKQDLMNHKIEFWKVLLGGTGGGAVVSTVIAFLEKLTG